MTRATAAVNRVEHIVKKSIDDIWQGVVGFGLLMIVGLVLVWLLVWFRV